MGALETTAKKIAPLIRLLASDHAGEIVAAAAGIARVLNSAGFDLNDLADDVVRVGVADRPNDPPHVAKARRESAKAPTGPTADSYWFGHIGTLWARGQNVLDERDLGFLKNVWARAQRGLEPSHGQQKWLADIEGKLDRREARAG